MNQNSERKTPARKSIQSVEIGMRVIEAVMRQPHGSGHLRDIATSSEMSRSQAHRYLLAFVNSGMVQQDETSGRYSLGELALKIGLSALSRLDVLQTATEHLDALLNDMETTGLMSIWGDHGPTVVRWRDGGRPLFTSLYIGSTLPVQLSSTGRVFMAFLPDDYTRELVKKERQEGLALTDDDLQKKLADAREQFFATSDSTVIPGLTAISTPVFDMQGKIIAVITAVGRSSDKRFFSKANIERVKKSGREASQELGWNPDLGECPSDEAADTTMPVRGIR